MLRGIPEGSYKLMYDAVDATNYNDVTQDVTVTFGKVLDLGTKTLVK
jgi:hypothetical protein